MARKPSPTNPSCPHCKATHIIRNGGKDGHPHWVCRQCHHSFGPTYGTPLYRLRTSPEEVGRTLLILMRRGSLSAAEGITGHKHETIGRWLRAGAQHAQVISEVLVRGLHLTEMEVGAFWSFVKRSVSTLMRGQARRAQWTGVGMSDPRPAQVLGGGEDFWGLGEGRRSQGRAPGAVAHSGAAGYPLGT